MTPTAIALRVIPRHEGSVDVRQAATFALGVIPDFPDKAFMAFDTELNDHIDEQIQEVLNVGAR
jgi:hypothetical protein